MIDLNQYPSSSSLGFVRLIAAIVCAGSCCVAFSQTPPVVPAPVATQTADRTGTFLKSQWAINANHALIWDGVPYIPVGSRIDADVASVTAADANKIKDVIVDVPANGTGWLETVKALEEKKMHYLLRINSLAPMAHGFTIEPQGYRIPGISKKTHIELPMPGIDSALVILAAQRDGRIASQARVPIINGKLEYDADPGPNFEHILLIYPEMDSVELPDYWETMDAHRDQLLASIRKANLGAGMRGLVNPIGKAVALPGRELAFVPTSPFFHLELRNFLEEKYKSVQTATRSWSIIGSDLDSFDAIARLVPLWNGDRGVPNYLDPTTNKIYNSDRRYSNAWGDIASVIQTAGARRFDRLVTSIRSVANVPVVQEWAGWSSPYETKQPAIDGLGMRSTGSTQAAVLDSACRATSSLLRWANSGWLLATDVDLEGGAPDTLPAVLDDLSGLGARGFFVRSDSADVLKTIAAENERKSSDPGLPTSSPTAVFYPENATNPANPQHLAGTSWWLPTPEDGNRIDLGTQFYAYRTAKETAIWAVKPGRYKLRMIDPKKALFRTIDSTDCDPKIVKLGVEVNISQLPLIITGIDDIPIPEAAYVETAGQVDVLQKIATTNHQDVLAASVAFRTAIEAFEKNPGGSFPQMRTELYRLSYQLGDYIWQEAERTTKTNFSEAATVTGASGTRCLMLDTQIAPGPEGYYAEYPIPVRSREPQEVWIAARIPAGRRKDITVSIGDQILKLPDAPVTLYGQGIGWYKLGTTRLAGNLSTMRIIVNSEGAPIAIDTILLTPSPFTPTDVRPPLPSIDLGKK
ncbi:hypothetical protein BH11ARM1_BH11ARM1_03410 [soil metagenome]